MNSTTKHLFFISVILLVVCLGSCKDKRHDLSKEYKLEHYAFVLVSVINDREFYLKLMRENIQEKKKTLLNPGRRDTLSGDPKYIAEMDQLFFLSDTLLYVPVKKIDSSGTGNTDPPENFTKEEAVYLNKQVDSLVTLFRQINRTYKQFYDYYQAADYKKDNSARGLALVDSIHLLDQQFGRSSDSLILASDRMFKEIYKVPDGKSPYEEAAAQMKGAINACNSYNALLDSVISDKKPYNNITGNEQKALADSIGEHHLQLVHRGLFGTERSIWADVVLLNFRDQLSGFRHYYEVRLDPQRPKGGAQVADLDFLKDQESRMRRYYAVFMQL